MHVTINELATTIYKNPTLSLTSSPLQLYRASV